MCEFKFLRIGESIKFGFVELHLDLLPKDMLLNDPSIQGGGKFSIDFKNKEIHLFHKSYDYGIVKESFMKSYFSQGLHLEGSLYYMFVQMRAHHYRSEGKPENEQLNIEDFKVYYKPYGDIRCELIYAPDTSAK